MIKIKQNVLTLRGVTLRGSLEVFNSNQILAVIFQVQSPNNFQLCIQPKRGIIMQNEIKIIKFWVRAEDRDRAFTTSFTGKSVRISTTFRSEYNRRIFEKMSMTGWEKTQSSSQTVEIPIIVSSTARQDIRNSVSNSLNKYSNSRQFFNQRKDQFKVGQSYNSNNFRSFPKINQKKISDKLDRQLDYLFQSEEKVASVNNKIIPPYLQGGQGQTVQYLNNYNNSPFSQGRQIITYNGSRNTSSNFSPRKQQPEIVTYVGPTNIKSSYQPRQGPQIVTYIGPRNTDISKPETAYYLGPNDLTAPSKPMEYNKKANDQRFLQIILLAALAGFFAALGSNFKQLFH